MTAPLEFQGISAGYGERTVVAGASFSVAPGELVGLVGPNGAGKSTLLRAVTGAADVTAGDITCGASLLRMPQRERARTVGVVPQSQPTTFAFTARAFVEMGRHAHLGRLQSPGPRDRAVVDSAMERTDTARLADERIDELSGGDLQRLTLAQALAQEPQVLLLDEPTSHLDLNHALQVLDLVRECADAGMAVLGVFHDLELAARYADRIAVVADGALIPPAPPAEAIDARLISDVFGVRAVVRTDPVTGTLGITPVLRGADLSSEPGGASIGLVCGSGTGAALMRRLALGGYRVFAGALNRGDVDEAVAEAVGAGFEELPPFGEIDPATAARVRARYARCEAIAVCETPFARANLPNLEAALTAGVPLVLVGEMTPERDFAHGDAAALWAEALSHGAVGVASDAEAIEALGRLAGRESR